MQDVLLNRLKFYEAQALLVGFRIRLAKKKLAFQDGIYNAYVDKLDFSDESKYWKSTFDAKKVKDQLAAENEEYHKQAKELDMIHELLRCIEATTDFVKSVQWSSWGRKGEEKE